MQKTATPRGAFQTLPFILFALAALALSGCASMIPAAPIGLGIPLGLGVEALLIYLTRPGELPPADTADQIAPHESWCYRSAANPQCYAHPLPGQASRLIMVDPANRYPLTAEAYDQIVLEDQRMRAPPPVMPAPAPNVIVTTPGSDLVVSEPIIVAPPPKHATKKKSRKPRHAVVKPVAPSAVPDIHNDLAPDSLPAQ